MELRLEGLVAAAGAFRVGPVSLRIPAGACGALTGPAGAGKSTLLETIAGLRAAAGGHVHVGAHDVTTAAPEHRAIGLVSQHALLFEHLSVRENIAYGARAESQVSQAMALTRAEPLQHAPVRGLSGGERQLVALARAIAAEPTVLLLDEPFAAMDEALQATVRTAVLAHLAARGTTVLLVTHDPRDLHGITHQLALGAHG